MQQHMGWVVECQNLRSQLSQARKYIETLLKASQLEVRTRTEGKFLAALEIVGVQEDVASFKTRERRQTEALKRQLQEEHSRRFERNKISQAAVVNAEQAIRMRAEEETRAL